MSTGILILHSDTHAFFDAAQPVSQGVPMNMKFLTGLITAAGGQGADPQGLQILPVGLNVMGLRQFHRTTPEKQRIVSTNTFDALCKALQHD